MDGDLEGDLEGDNFCCHERKMTVILGQVQAPLAPVLIYVIDMGAHCPLDSVLLDPSAAVSLILSLRH